MRKRIFQVAATALAVLGISGCGGMWNDFFGGGSGSSRQAATLAPGDLEQCATARDPNIATKLANNVPCSADTQCPSGSFCTGNGVSGTCIRECGDGLPKCTGNRYCSCQGVCENLTPGGLDGGSSAAPATCERNATLLEDIKNDPSKAIACESDDICPNGSYCSPATARCDWDCLDPVTPCAAGLTCDCSGRCFDGDAGATIVRRKFELLVSPSVVEVTPGVGKASWVRTVDVSLRTRDETLLGGSGDTRSFTAKVTVRPGSSLKVACSQTGTAPNYQANGCDLGTGADTWQFTRVADAWVAAKTVWMRPNDATDAGTGAPPADSGVVTVGQEWAIILNSDDAWPLMKTVQVAVGAAKAATQWTPNPGFDFSGDNNHPKGYQGRVLLKTPLGFAWDSLPGVEHELLVPVKASVHQCSDEMGGVCLTFVDPTTLFLQEATLTISTTGGHGSDLRPWLAIEKAGKQVAQGQVRIDYQPDGLTRNERTGGLQGKFAGYPWGLFYNGYGPQVQGQFDLEVDSSFVSCTDDSSCKGGATCQVESGLCVNVAPAVRDDLPMGLEHGTRVVTDDVYAAHAMVDPALILGNLYRAPSAARDNPSIFQKDDLESLGSRSAILAPSAIARRAVADHEVFEDHNLHSFADLLSGLQASQYSTKLWKSGTADGPGWVDCDLSSRWDCLTASFYTVSTNNMIPCVDERNYDGTTPAHYDVSNLGGGEWAASCQKLWNNVKNAASPADTTDFTSVCEQGNPGLSLDLQAAGDSIVEKHRIFYCPRWLEPVLWGPTQSTGTSRGVDAAYRFMCFDVNQNEPNRFRGSTLNPLTTLSIAGEHACQLLDGTYTASGPDDTFPSGIDFLYRADRMKGQTDSKTKVDWMQSCIYLSDYHGSANAPSDQQSMDNFLRANYSPTGCMSPVHFFAALDQARESVQSDKDLYNDVPTQRLYLRLLQQWLEMHSFLATEGLEQYRLAKEEQGSALPTGTGTGSDVQDSRAPVELTEILTAVESGFALILDLAGTDGMDLGVSAEAVRQPDYRKLMPGAAGPNDQQLFGVAPQLLETATDYLRAMEEYLKLATLDAYAQVADGTIPQSLVEARRRVGFGIRLVSAIEAVSAALVNLAQVRKEGCNAATEQVDCHGQAKCSAQDGSRGYCLSSPWYSRWDNARKSYLRVRRELADQALADANPLGISENDLPLFFGDLSGTNSRFFAASDYLINTWATNAVASAQGSLDKAREAWISRRNATFQDVMNQQEQDRRMQALKQKYGQIIAENCGLGSDVRAEDVLDWAKKIGWQIDDCFMARDMTDKDKGLICTAPNTAPGVAKPEQTDIDTCVSNLAVQNNASYLEEAGYFNSGYPLRGAKCSTACANYYKLETNPLAQATVKVRIASTSVPDAALTGTSKMVLGGSGWFEDESVGHPCYWGFSYCHDHLNMLHVCDFAVKDKIQALCLAYDTLLFGRQVACIPSWYADWEAQFMTLLGSNMPTGRKLWKGVCNCVDGKLRGECRYDGESDSQWNNIDKNLSCGPQSLKFGYNVANVCYNSGQGKILVEHRGGTDDSLNGTWDYTACGMRDCAPAPAGGKDPCGMDTVGYSEDRYWMSSATATVCLADEYREESCNQKDCQDAATAALGAYKITDAERKEYEGECEENIGVAKDKLTVIPNPPECYRGLLGTAALKVYGALQDVDLAKMAWTAAQESFSIQGRLCAKIEGINDESKARDQAFVSQMGFWRDAKAVADSIAVACANAAGSMSSFGASNAATPFQIASIDLDRKMNTAREEFDSFMREQAAKKEVLTCYTEVDKLRAQFEVEKGQIVRRATDLGVARDEFGRLLDETKRAINEGLADVAAEEGRTVPSFAHSYWYDEKAERYLREFDWAKRLVYLAMRAVEYEFQQSLGIRKDILTATHPDQLEAAIQSMQAEVATRAINRRRPEAAATVLSLRDDILGIVDLSNRPESGSRNWAPVQSFRAKLWDNKYALYDKDGKWVGQGIPFTMKPQGALLDRCAERLWQVTATIQGDGLSDTEPGAAIKLLKRNTFNSQWCAGLGDGSPVQVGHLEPSSNLFKQDPGTPVAGETDAFSTAAIYPWFNVRRADFYKTQYAEGSSQELAGRGLYGDYILLFPSELLEGREVPNPPDGQIEGLRIDQFPLDRVEDVLLRFDYLSVDNFAARGVQPTQ
jgi:hypothetical protein